MSTENIGKKGDDFKFDLDIRKEISKTIKKIGIVGTGLVTAGLAIGAALIAIESTVGLAAAGGAIAAAFSALMAATGPFLASSLATIGAFLSALNPIVLPAIATGVVVVVAIALVVHLTGKNSKTSKVMDLLSIPNRTEAQNDKLAGLLRAWAEEGKVENLKNLLKGRGGETFDRELFFREDDDGNSVESLLIEQKNADLLFLLKGRTFDENSPIFSAVQWACEYDRKTNEATKETQFFLIHVADHNFELAKNAIKKSILSNNPVEDSFEYILLQADSYDGFVGELFQKHPNFAPESF